MARVIRVVGYATAPAVTAIGVRLAAAGLGTTVSSIVSASDSCGIGRVTVTLAADVSPVVWARARREILAGAPEVYDRPAQRAARISARIIP